MLPSKMGDLPELFLLMQFIGFYEGSKIELL